MARYDRVGELQELRRQCSMDCFAVTVRDTCGLCGESTIQCLTHGWKLRCRCEREHDAAMQSEADAYYRQLELEHWQEIGFDVIAMGM